ncbi:MAG: indole-3-glycerol phosphate synthase TrpC [Ferruginibacter sp.]|nr:indole-3-glycerol phosphate synthase TrpC [Ferruginibacter sp.]
MKNILDEIIIKRKEAVTQLKQLVPVAAWEMMPAFSKKTKSLKKALQTESNTGIIAEFKRASPSKGIINKLAKVDDVTASYELHGAAAISILTEPEFFKGSNDDLLEVSSALNIPVLRKDFIFDEYQLIESKALGADVILLIAACLTPAQVKNLATFAKQLNLEVILEIHDETELGHICNETELIGVNNRNLKTFTVDINRSLQLGQQIPPGKIKIAESGINKADTINVFKKAGFKGFLMGENFMKEQDPGLAFRNFVNSLHH